MMNIIKNIIRRAVVTLAGADDKDFPTAQVSYLGKAADIEIITPYGVHANLPANNQVIVTMFSVAGQEDQRVGMGYTPLLRPKQLPEGEVVFYHPLTQSRIQFKNNGDIEIDATGDNGSAIVTIKKDLTITVGGDASIAVDGTATVTCPTTNWTGDINVTGKITVDDLEVTGSTEFGATVTSNGKDISDTHMHTGVTTGLGVTGPPQ